MKQQSGKLDVIRLCSKLRLAIDEKNLIVITEVNDCISEMIESGGLDRNILISQQKEIRELYSLIREAEELMRDIRSEVKAVQADMQKKRKSSKSYREVGKL